MPPPYILMTIWTKHLKFGIITPTGQLPLIFRPVLCNLAYLFLFYLFPFWRKSVWERDGKRRLEFLKMTTVVTMTLLTSKLPQVMLRHLEPTRSRQTCLVTWRKDELHALTSVTREPSGHNDQATEMLTEWVQVFKKWCEWWEDMQNWPETLQGPRRQQAISVTAEAKELQKLNVHWPWLCHWWTLNYYWKKQSAGITHQNESKSVAKSLQV